jgi:ABC-2 type transport system permease protein
MENKYNQLRAMLAIAKGSFKALLRNPSAVAFTFVFPLVIIFVFGFIGGTGPKVGFALARQSDTANFVVQGLLKNPMVQLSHEKDTAILRNDLLRGRIGAILSFDSAQSSFNFIQYTVHMQTSSAGKDKYPILQLALAQVFERGVELKAPVAARPFILDVLPAANIR